MLAVPNRLKKAIVDPAAPNNGTLVVSSVIVYLRLWRGTVTAYTFVGIQQQRSPVVI